MTLVGIHNSETIYGSAGGDWLYGGDVVLNVSYGTFEEGALENAFAFVA